MSLKAVLGLVADRARWLYRRALRPGCTSSQRELIYFPQFTRTSRAATDFEPRPSTAWSCAAGWSIRASRDASIYFGGNAEPHRGDARRTSRSWFPDRSGYLRALSRLRRQRRRAERSGPVRPMRWSLYDQVHSRHPDGRIAVIGRSLGSGVASYVAAHRPVAKLALVTPFDSMARLAQTHYPLCRCAG